MIFAIVLISFEGGFIVPISDRFFLTNIVSKNKIILILLQFYQLIKK